MHLGELLERFSVLAVFLEDSSKLGVFSSKRPPGPHPRPPAERTCRQDGGGVAQWSALGVFKSCPEDSQAQPESRTPPCGGPPATPTCASYCFPKLGARTTSSTTTTGVYPENEDLPRALEVQASADGAQGSGVGKLPRDERHSCWPVTSKEPPSGQGPGRACPHAPSSAGGLTTPPHLPVCLGQSPTPRAQINPGSWLGSPQTLMPATCPKHSAAHQVLPF